MATGKKALRLAPTFAGNVEASLADIYIAVNELGSAHLKSAGEAFITTSVTLTKGQAVSLSAGALILADSATSKPAIGVAAAGAAIGNKARIIFFSGLITDLTGLTADTSVYLGNAGALLFAKPVSGFIQGIGYALSATELFVAISQP